MKPNQIVRSDSRIAIALRHSMEELWSRISNDPDTDGFDLEEELYWVYLIGARQVVVVNTMEELGSDNSVRLCTIKLCKSRNSEIVRWYV